MIRTINIGLGHRGRQWVNWARHAGADVVGVVDADPATLQQAGETLGFGPPHRFTSVDDAVAILRPQAAVICAPHAAHPALAKVCLQHGMHVLIEKPLAGDMSTAHELVRLAEQQGLQLAISLQYRYGEAVRRLKSLVADGHVGSVTNGVIQFYRWRPTQGMRLPILLNQAIHHFDALRYIMGQTPVACTGHLWDPDWNGCDGPTVVEATFRFANGTRVHYSGSYVAQGEQTPFDGVWRFEGSTGQLLYNGARRVVINRMGLEPDQHVVGERGESDTIALCRDFLRSIGTGEPSPTHGRDHLNTLAMVLAVELSAQQRSEIVLADLIHD